MIVRDEEAMLPDFLAAVDGLWDEFIAVDTGSRDGSAAILAGAGATVVPFTWCDDFAAARNASLEQASGDWILFLDADERVSPALARQIRQLLKDGEAGAATVVMRNRLPGGHRRDSRLLRLFRNDPAIRFRYRIHEDVSGPVQEHLKRWNRRLRHLPGVVEHLGYVRAVAEDRRKKDRDLELLRLALSQDPDDFYCRFKILEIARFWEDLSLWREEAAACARLVADLDDRRAHDLKQRSWSGELAALVVQGLGLPVPEALAWLQSSRRWASPTAAWLLRRGHLLEEAGRRNEAAACYRDCLAAEDEAASQLISVRPMLGLCRLAAGEGKMEEACDLAAGAAAAGPVDPEALLALMNLSRLAEQPHLWRGFLQQNPEAALPAARICLRAAQPAEAEALLAPLADGDAEAALGLLVCRLVLGGEFDFQLDVDQQQADDLMRPWVRDLWQCRRADLLEAFAGRCGAVAGVFPWLPAFLAEETRQLRGQPEPVSSSRR
jgi:hypothetical protein